MRLVSAALAASLFAACVLFPTSARGARLKLAVGDVGLGIGDVPRLDGVRLDFRDRDLERVRGINATLWAPHENAGGLVQGIALGLPVTGAGQIQWLSLGVGLGATHDLSGISAAPFGLGAGDDIQGIAVGGFGLGAGGDIKGIAVGGLGLGTGRNVTGI